MTIISIFVIFLLSILPCKIKSEITMKFKRQYLLSEYDDLFQHGINFFVDYLIKNKYTTDIYMGEPPQKISGYLNPSQSGFYLTNKFCPFKNVYNYQNSINYKFIDRKVYGKSVIERFSDTLYFEYINKTNFKKTDYEFFSDVYLDNPICCILGFKLLGIGETVEDNLLYRLHRNKSIKSYYFTFDIDKNNIDELNYIFDIDIKNNEKGYTFIKSSSYIKDNRQYLVWGLDFDSFKLNNSIIHEKQFRAEFNINLGCIIASSSFKEELDLILGSILDKKENYDNYYIYIFNINKYDKLKDFNMKFYHKLLDYDFILDYNDLFYEKNGLLYFLILFNSNEQDYWEFGIPFLKKYNFIYNQDNKFMGFIKENNGNTNNSNEKNDTKFSKSKIILIIVLVLICIIIVTLFFGYLIGKKIYKVRKNKTNELLELYDYNSKSDK